MESGVGHNSVRNMLLRLLSTEDFHHLSSHLEPVDLPRLYVIARAGEPIRHAYFPEAGIGSIIVRSSEGQSVEIGMFGREGMSPPALAAGSDQSPMEIFMQVPGSGYRIASPVLLAAIEERAALRQLLARYAHALTVQTAYTALSNAIHTVEMRLARWLLMCDDRVDSHEIPLTHDFMSVMLAVRRPSVTTALHLLEGRRFIQSERGYVTIRDRAAMEAFAAEAYGQPEEEYRRLIGSEAECSDC